METLETKKFFWTSAAKKSFFDKEAHIYVLGTQTTIVTGSLYTSAESVDE